VNGLYKGELIYRQGPWRTAGDVEGATLAWVDWWNNRPESPERPDREPPRVNLLAAEAEALAPGAPPAQRPNPLSLPVACGGDLGGSAFVPLGV
jgi:hypothetical protein